MDDVEAYMEDI